ncbi:MAG: cysteine desulfurase [Candidatus Hydrogenedentes bacterium]|nr:cysteine desulfurase [Candidatus Hydrogenedentota bacterium]
MTAEADSTGARGQANPPRPPLAEGDVARIRQDFPLLHTELRGGKPLVYLDNASTTQRPRAVVDAVDEYYLHHNANIHRGVHQLSQAATDAYERAREAVRRFVNAQLTGEIVFTRGTTESINLIAQTFGRTRIGPGDEVLVSEMEHHSNIVPWQMLCQERGARVRPIPVTDAGEISLEEYGRLFNEKTKLVAVIHVSNALGTVNPVKHMIDTAHAHGVPVVVDGAQSAAHLPVDVQDLDCDFYACSGHKMCGPTGIGVLYGKAEHLEAMPPYQGGGDMILSVSFGKTVYNTFPHKFEAGTPDIAGAIGLGAAVEYLESIGMEPIAAYERALTRYGTQLLASMDGVRLIGTAHDKAPVFSFCMACASPDAIGQVLDEEGIAVRTGHHCAQPLMERFHIPGTARASLAFYNTRQELDALAEALNRVKAAFP